MTCITHSTDMHWATSRWPACTQVTTEDKVETILVLKELMSKGRVKLGLHSMQHSDLGCKAGGDVRTGECVGENSENS